MKKGKLFVISAPSGTGKTTLVEMLTREFPNVKRSVTCTTRLPRAGEVADRDYHFLTEKEFLERKQRGDFLESAEVFDTHYGTLKSDVQKEHEAGRHLILVIDTQGALQVRAHMTAVLIFIAPPTLAELRRRLEARNTESEKSIEERLSWAKAEIDMGKGNYDYFLINEDLDSAYQVLRSIFIAEEHKR